MQYFNNSKKITYVISTYKTVLPSSYLHVVSGIQIQMKLQMSSMTLVQHILDKHNNYDNNAVAEEKAGSSTKQIRVSLDHLHLIASAI